MNSLCGKHKPEILDYLFIQQIIIYTIECTLNIHSFLSPISTKTEAMQKKKVKNISR